MNVHSESCRGCGQCERQPTSGQGDEPDPAEVKRIAEYVRQAASHPIAWQDEIADDDDPWLREQAEQAERNEAETRAAAPAAKAGAK